MQSSIASLLYLTGITYYAGELSYGFYETSESYLYWMLLLAALPYYYRLYRKKPESNFMIFHNWMVPLSLIIILGTVAKDEGELMYIAYFSLFGLLYLIGNSTFFKLQRLRNNGYKILGSLGTIVMLLILSFDWFWDDLRNNDLHFNEVITSPEFFASLVISLLCLGIFYFQQKNKSPKEIEPIAIVSLLFIITFIIGLSSLVSVVLINFFVFTIGILTILDGAKNEHLGILNYGLLIIVALAICRFFDTDLSFVIRGILFVSVGIGFFATNYWMIKKRKTNE
jgi:hypothetical protein